MDEIQEIAAWLELFVAPEQVTELRAVEVGDFPHTEAGFFDREHLTNMAQVAWRLSTQAIGVYFVPNPINPDLLARAANKARRATKGMATTDKDIMERRWLLIDADPVRPEGISSTDEEKQYAWDLICQVREFVIPHGFQTHVLADSGNGYHLLCRVEKCPAQDKNAVRQFLHCLADRFDTDQVKIDRKVFNPARIVKLYGTWSRKGDSTEKRPHRRSRVLEASL